jgi:hypothetical protein
MAANTLPIFGRLPHIGWVNNALAANTAKDAASGTVYTAFTADATNGSFVESIRFRARGTNVATVARIFINNGGVTTTAANNVLFHEVTLPATTLSEIAALAPIALPINVALPPGYRILITLGTAVAAGYDVAVTGADY